MLQMIVKGIGLDTSSGQPILVLTDKNKVRALPILIGAAEASSISYGLAKTQVERPLTHDLMLNTIKQLGYKASRVDLNDEKNGAYIASIVLEPLKQGKRKPKTVVIDARPSDAIAMAVRDDIPIYVHESLILSGSIAIDEEKDQADKDEFSKFVESVKPSDFKLSEEESSS
ncbi:MAG: bifunctional nuclease family protein [Candidatus Obscuribacterales bacterium]|nr:bifunctional nuclease family protein [Cyanobacteria bacterium HKST-UBA01]MCB9469553.1 bifunctional nuclease family protein [Candidatus Obscuribacterales bacterium]